MNDPWRILGIFLIVCLSVSFGAPLYLVAVFPPFWPNSLGNLLELVHLLSYPAPLIVGLYWVGRRLVASRGVVATVLLTAIMMGEAFSTLTYVFSGNAPSPSMPSLEYVSATASSLYTMAIDSAMTFFVAIGALALPNWLKVAKNERSKTTE